MHQERQRAVPVIGAALHFNAIHANVPKKLVTFARYVILATALSARTIASNIGCGAFLDCARRYSGSTRGVS